MILTLIDSESYRKSGFRYAIHGILYIIRTYEVIVEFFYVNFQSCHRCNSKFHSAPQSVEQSNE